ncbi:BlaI/MecI/CopY family transcriptional regulator, partial [Streptomyces sp. NPDC005921]
MRRLGDLEAEIMDRLWRWRRSATVREIVDDINRTRPVAYTTVMTVDDLGGIAPHRAPLGNDRPGAGRPE